MIHLYPNSESSTPLVILDFAHGDRAYLQTKGWKYIGSREIQTGDKASTWTHYYVHKGGPAHTTWQALASELSSVTPKHPPVVIPPDIQAMDVTRQYKLQLARKRLGRCIRCARYRDGKSTVHCSRCNVQIREKVRTKNGTVVRYLSAGSYTKERVSIKSRMKNYEGEM